MPQLCEWAILNGEMVQADQAKVSAFDRGFLFAHAAYEVTAVYGARLIDWPGHLARVKRTMAALELPSPYETDKAWETFHHALISRNKLFEGLIYLQVSGGDAGPRDFYGPETFSPSIFMFANRKPLIGEAARDGLHAISRPDERWRRRDLKTTQLLSQAQAYRAARAAGADTALMHEDGLVTEAASANAWIVDPSGTVVTRPLSSALLPGITRDRVFALLKEDGLPIEERAFTLEDVQQAQEAFTTSSGALIAPLLSLDGAAVADGAPGPVTRRVQHLYYEFMGADVSTAAPWLAP